MKFLLDFSEIMKGGRVFQRPPGGCAAGLREQRGEHRYEGRTDQHHTATGHELLHALRLRAGVIVAVAFHEVDNTPHRETGTESDNEGLQNTNCLRSCLASSQAPQKVIE